jgi:hypothetical protein
MSTSDPATGMSWWHGIGAAVNRLVAASNAGYTVSADAGQALLKAIDTLHGKVSEHLRRAGELKQVVPLGSSPAANAYKPFLRTILTNAEQGMVPALTLLKRDLERAHDAIQKNMADYQRAEADNAVNIAAQDAARRHELPYSPRWRRHCWELPHVAPKRSAPRRSRMPTGHSRSARRPRPHRRTHRPRCRSRARVRCCRPGT